MNYLDVVELERVLEPRERAFRLGYVAIDDGGCSSKLG